MGRKLANDWTKLLKVDDGVFINYGLGDRNSMVTACRKYMVNHGMNVKIRSVIDPKKNVLIAIFEKP